MEEDSQESNNRSDKKKKNETTLKDLAKQFVNMCQTSEDGLIDLNSTIGQFNVKKRRIYDVTNVLEGVGLIEKQKKNYIKWVGSKEEVDMDKDYHKKKETCIHEINQMKKRVQELDRMISEKRNGVMMTRAFNRKKSFITFTDICKVPTFDLTRSSLISIQLPRGAKVLKGYNGKEGKWQLRITQNGGGREKVKVFLINEKKEN